MSSDLSMWHDRLMAVIRRKRLTLFDRVFVMTETSSTQDAALRLAGGEPGAIILAGRQTSGRGRFGRTWHSDGCLAITFVVSATDHPAAQLSLACGIAAAAAVEYAVGNGFRAGVRWPNDIVEFTPGPSGDRRKLAGVLIEVVGPLALIGIGINVEQEDGAWPPDLVSIAVSVRQLGAHASRIEVAEHLLVELCRALAMPRDALCRQWGERDTLVGHRTAFMCNGARVEGVVEAITPDVEIVLRTSEGRVQRLNAQHASLIHHECAAATAGRQP